MYNNASKSFQKALIKYTEAFFLENVGEILNPKEISICFPCKPIYLDINAETYVEEFQIGGYAGPHVFICKLYWWHKDKTHEIKLLDDVKPSEINFRIEVYRGFESLKKDLLTRARLKNERFVEGYRFVVLIKNIEIDARLKIKFQDIVNSETTQNVSEYLGHAINNFNSLSENNDNGLIHSYRFISKTKEYLSFKLDLGSSSKEGVEFILKAFDESNFQIVKIELMKI